MEIYKIRRIRTVVVKIRVFFMVNLFRKLKTINAENGFDKTVSHNLKGLYHCNDRIKLLINPLTVIERLNSKSKILVIGPRNENDLYLLYSEGFKKKNITGLDLISYSSKIKLGDMHHMPFEDNSFDAVIFGWTLSYSSAPQKAINEVIRVLKPNGIAAVGVEYSVLSKEDSEQLLSYSIQEYNLLEVRINSVEQILNLFANNVKTVYFNHNAPLQHSHFAKGLVKNVSNVATIVEINK